MTEDELRQAISLGREQRGVEFKGPGRRTDRHFQSKVTRAVLGMANKPGGGVVVIGIRDDGTALNPEGLSPEDLATWSYDDFASNVSTYADPYVDFGLGIVEMEGKYFVAVEVSQFDELPVICKDDYDNILRKGALYVRPRGKNETVEVPSHVEMRDIVGRAAEFMARDMLASHEKLREIEHSLKQTKQASEASFDAEAKDLLKEAPFMSGIIEKIRSRGSRTVRIRPGTHKEDRVSKLGDLEEAVRKSAVELRGWDFPHFDYKSDTTRASNYVEQQLEWNQYVETWRAYKSGQFISLTAIHGDWRDHSALLPQPPDWHWGTTLSVEDAIFRFTEVFEFAARWANTIPVGEEMVVECTMQGLQNRVLRLSQRRVGFIHDPKCSAPNWNWSKHYPTAVLFSTPRDHAVDPAISLFELFGWDATREAIRDIQNGLRG